MSSASKLRVSEIFHSLQGESNTVGLPTVFVRLTGCPLRCVYCDTTYAFKGGEWQTLPQVVDRVARFGARRVTVTGGEPLAQALCPELLTMLCDAGHLVSLETSGALDISVVDPRVVRVMDLKTPASGEVERNLYANLEHLRATDQVKFVISDRADYEWSVEQCREHRLMQRCEVLFSPTQGSQQPRQLAEWILHDGLEVRFQIQLHKLLWGDESGR